MPCGPVTGALRGGERERVAIVFPGQACQTERTADASAAAWARPALAAAARRDTLSTLRPVARTAARSGRASATRAPAAVSAAACRPELADHLGYRA
jgi:hypothetical protein